MKKFYFVFGILFLFFEMIYCQDAKIKLNSADGSTAFEVQDSLGVTQLKVDSDGNLIVVGTTTVQGNKLGFPQRGIVNTSSMTVQLTGSGQEVVVNRADGAACFVIKDDYNFYPRVYERRIYDDASNYLLAITTHTYVESLGIKTNQIKDSAGTRVVTIANDTTANTTVTTVHGDLRVNNNRLLDSAGTERVKLGSDILFTAGVSTFTGNIRVSGNNIQDSGGTTRITLGDLSTYSSTVTVRGLTVQGDLNISQGRLSDNSIVSADILDGTIQTADIGDRQVSSGKLLITSTYTYSAGPFSTNSNTWSTLGGLTGSFTTVGPATIFLYFTAGPTWRTESSQWAKIGYRFNVAGNGVGYAENYREYNAGPETRYNVALVATYRVATAGTYTVSVEWRSGDDGGAWGTANCANASFVAFWVGSP